MNRKVKLGTLLCAIGLTFMVTQLAVLADKEIGHGSYTSKSGKLYKYKWLIDNKGKKYTEWTIDGEKQQNYDGCITPGPGPGNVIGPGGGNLPLPSPNEGIGINLRYDGYYLMVESNQPIESTIYDPLTGKIVVEAFTIDYHQSIPAVNLEKGKTYYIWSTNNGRSIGMMFILNESQSIYISE